MIETQPIPPQKFTYGSTLLTVDDYIMRNRCSISCGTRNVHYLCELRSENTGKNNDLMQCLFLYQYLVMITINERKYVGLIWLGSSNCSMIAWTQA